MWAASAVSLSPHRSPPGTRLAPTHHELLATQPRICVYVWRPPRGRHHPGSVWFTAAVDFLAELLAQMLAQIAVEGLLTLGFKGGSAVLGSRMGRYIVAAVIGFFGGLWWGHHATATGLGHEPRSLWVSVMLGGFALVAAMLAESREEPSMTGWRRTLPWTWTRDRWYAFVLLNAAIGGGIVLGFRPPA